MLCIWDNEIGDEGLWYITDYLRDLNYLYVWNNNITDNGIKQVVNLKQLEGLYIQ